MFVLQGKDQDILSRLKIRRGNLNGSLHKELKHLSCLSLRKEIRQRKKVICKRLRNVWLFLRNSDPGSH